MMKMIIRKEILEAEVTSTPTATNKERRITTATIA
jgi:hypothetical protein